MLDHFGVTEANWRRRKRNARTSRTPKPLFFVGRALAAIATPNVKKKSVKVFNPGISPTNTDSSMQMTAVRIGTATAKRTPQSSDELTVEDAVEDLDG
jgi:hypothetical protein